MAFDVCVIGSGPAGGVLSKELAEAGAKVALVEAGRVIRPEEFQFHAWPYELPFRGKRRPGTPPPAYPKEVREAIRYEDSDPIGVDRIRAVGGRSIHWNAVALRFAERDFRERSLEGVEEDWPLTYQELAPYYSHVEKMIGVTGSRENLEIIPDGEFLPPLNLRCSEQIVKRACNKMGIRMIPARKAVLTRPYDNRPACHYCGRCMEGCDVGAVFSVPVSMFPKAMKTGNFTLLANKIVRELQVDREGRVRSASVIDAVSRKEEAIEASIFAVCCGAPESARLLLNSRSPQFPHGLANSNDMVGRYLHGNVAANVIGYLEDLAGTHPINNDGATDHTYIPRFNHLSGKQNRYSGGFHFQLNYAGFLFPHQAKLLDGFGSAFKREVRKLQPGFVQMGCWGKVLALPENRVTVDRNQLDAWGIPIPVLRFRFGENDLALWKDMVEKAREILHAAGAHWVVNTLEAPAGFGSHEAGTVRMGHDKRTSVLNSYCQAHEVKNLFVVGGSAFTTYPEKNPTLTIMALAVRTARYMAEEVKKRHLRL
ncbi:MAG: GMC family oxidoreductase [Acidimicrobiia bacterium]|nr:GMC family oxidoreductase [Acidimicrobiia bacterium]